LPAPKPVYTKHQVSHIGHNVCTRFHLKFAKPDINTVANGEGWSTWGYLEIFWK